MNACSHFYLGFERLLSDFLTNVQFESLLWPVTGRLRGMEMLDKKSVETEKFK